VIYEGSIAENLEGSGVSLLDLGLQATVGFKMALVQSVPSFHRYLISRSKLSFSPQRVPVNLHTRKDKLAS
jgi:hypothetical protein